MKTLLVLLSLVIGASASAGTFNQLQLSGEKGQTNAQQPPQQTDPEQSATPIRVAKSRYKISRLEYVKQPDGSFDYKRTVLCTGNLDVNVFDVRGLKGGVVNGPSVTAKCTDSAAGKDLHVSGALVMTTEELIDKKEDVKYAFGSLYATVAAGEGEIVIQPIEFLGNSSGGTKDMNAKSFVIGVVPNLDTVKIGAVYYSALLDIED